MAAKDIGIAPKKLQLIYGKRCYRARLRMMYIEVHLAQPGFVVMLNTARKSIAHKYGSLYDFFLIPTYRI